MRSEQACLDPNVALLAPLSCIQELFSPGVHHASRYVASNTMFPKMPTPEVLVCHVFRPTSSIPCLPVKRLDDQSRVIACVAALVRQYVLRSSPSSLLDSRRPHTATARLPSCVPLLCRLPARSPARPCASDRVNHQRRKRRDFQHRPQPVCHRVPASHSRVIARVAASIR